MLPQTPEVREFLEGEPGEEKGRTAIRPFSQDRYLNAGITSPANSSTERITSWCVKSPKVNSPLK